jgi:predicted ATP-grasp superfamily ATP-dependent carboligase
MTAPWRRALVLDADTGPALAVARSLGRAGWDVVAPAGTRAAASRHARATVAIPDAADEPDGFATAVRAALAEDRVDVVVPCTDATVELVWANEDALDGARVMGADRRFVELVLDKSRALAAAADAGFPTPEWVAPATRDEAADALARVGLPAVVKPRRSYVRERGRLRHRRHAFVRSPDELDAALAAGAGADGALPIIQAFVPGRSLAVSAVVRGGRVLALAARETLTFLPLAGGTSVWKRTVAPTEPGVEAAVNLLRTIGYEGLVEVEYQVGADGVPRLMELGGRAHGWMPLAMAAGVDLPLVAARALVGDDLADGTGYRVGVEMRWPAGELFRLRTVLGPRAALPPGTSRLDVLSRAWPPWRPGMLYDGVDLRDMGPWLPTRLRRARSIRGAP